MKERVLAFFKRILEDVALQDQLGSIGRDLDGVVNLAATQGFMFDRATFLTTLEDLRPMSASELNDSELAQVAGGGYANIAWFFDPAGWQ